MVERSRGARAAFDAEMKRRAAASEQESKEKAGDADLLIEKATTKAKGDDDEPVTKGISVPFGTRTVFTYTPPASSQVRRDAMFLGSQVIHTVLSPCA